jgi:hypothetical protein
MGMGGLVMKAQLLEIGVETLFTETAGSVVRPGLLFTTGTGALAPETRKVGRREHRPAGISAPGGGF